MRARYLVALALGISVGVTPLSAAPLGPGDPAPNFFANNLVDDQWFWLNDFKGKVVVLTFFSTG